MGCNFGGRFGAARSETGRNERAKRAPLCCQLHWMPWRHRRYLFDETPRSLEGMTNQRVLNQVTKQARSGAPGEVVMVKVVLTAEWKKAKTRGAD